MGHLVLDGARTVDDVLKNTTTTIIKRSKTTAVQNYVQHKENSFKCNVTL